MQRPQVRFHALHGLFSRPFHARVARCGVCFRLFLFVCGTRASAAIQMACIFRIRSMRYWAILCTVEYTHVVFVMHSPLGDCYGIGAAQVAVAAAGADGTAAQAAA